MQLLVVDDDAAFNELLRSYLGRQGYSTSMALTVRGALEQINAQAPQLVLVDYQLPDGNGLDLMRQLKASHPQLPVILITSYADLRLAVNSIKLGAFEFVTKPVVPDELLKLVKLALNPAEVPSEKVTSKVTPANYVVGKNAAVQQLWQHLNAVAPTKMNVLIMGESGTGKEHLARTIHQQSRRHGGPFVSVDCGTLSTELAASELFGHVKGAFTGAQRDKTGLMEAAVGGTLFLDEIGNLALDTQAMLLRALQEGLIKRVGDTREIKVDVRVVAATNENLLQQVNEGGFRNDLYHRLNEFSLQVPPLRDRRDDLAEFCAFFVQQASIDFEKPAPTLSKAVFEAFSQYAWPGNLRELRNIIRRMVLLANDKVLEVAHLPAGLFEGLDEAKPATAETEDYDLKSIQETQERQTIVEALERFKYNKSKTAQALNIDRSTLYAKMKRYNIGG
ncbi:MAG: sigma-54-dependent transcriptional regulator [Bacteroidia bacterium]